MAMQCPRCDEAKLAYNDDIGKMQCPACGFRLFEDSVDGPAPAGKPSLPATPANELIAPPPAESDSPVEPPLPIDLPTMPSFISLSKPHISVQVRDRVRAIAYDAVDALKRGDRKLARKKFVQAVQIEDDFSDGWFFLAGLVDTREKQRFCLEHVLVNEPMHAAAQALMQQIRGDTAPSAAAKSPPGAAETIQCPSCGGTLELAEAQGQIRCQFCNHVILNVQELTRSGHQQTISAGLLKRQHRPDNWNIGQRKFVCQACGAETTAARQTLTNACRFCQSQQVAVVGLTGEYEQPDVVVPFAMDEQEAIEAVSQGLKSGIRRFTRFFAGEIRGVWLQGAYLPFWVFDADMHVKWWWTDADARGENTELPADVLWYAGPKSVMSLKHALKLEPFALRQAKDYDSRLLVEYPAQLYTVDVDQASLDVRGRLCKIAEGNVEQRQRSQRPRGHGSEDDPGQLEVRATTRFLTYRLALLPVWFGRIQEARGAFRSILVNGQTGELILREIEEA
jgi:DNA-directed RNA polymerase subunit RPC12/RpoP